MASVDLSFHLSSASSSRHVQSQCRLHDVSHYFCTFQCSNRYQPDHWCKIPFFNEQAFKTSKTNYTWDQVLETRIAFPTVSYSCFPNVSFRKLTSKEVKNGIRSVTTMSETMFTSKICLGNRSRTCRLMFRWKAVRNGSTTNRYVLAVRKLWLHSGNEEDRGHRMEQSLWQQLEQSPCSFELFARLSGWLLHGRHGQWQVSLSQLKNHQSLSYGRKTAIYGFSILSAIFGFLLIYSKEFEIFLVIRFLLAASNEAADLAAYVLCMEVTG